MSEISDFTAERFSARILMSPTRSVSNLSEPDCFEKASFMAEDFSESTTEPFRSDFGLALCEVETNPRVAFVIADANEQTTEFLLKSS